MLSLAHLILVLFTRTWNYFGIELGAKFKPVQSEKHLPVQVTH